jgi:DNA-binding response OmpR family regulator
MTTRPTILIAEDDLFLQTVYQKRFEIEGYHVELVSDGQRALEYLRAQKPDIAVLDIKLPKLNGLEVLSRMKGNAALKDIPVVILTGLLDISKMTEALEIGADGYMIKSETSFGDMIRFVNGMLQVKPQLKKDGLSAGEPCILLVDDDAFIRSIYKTRFLAEGYRVETAEDGDIAMEKLSHLPVDAVLLDVMLPKCNGFKVLAYMKLEERLKNIPVVMLTNLQTLELAEQAHTSGASGYVVKSRAVSEVVSIVRDRLLRNSA